MNSMHPAHQTAQAEQVLVEAVRALGQFDYSAEDIREVVESAIDDQEIE